MSDVIKRTIEWAIKKKSEALPSGEIASHHELGLTRAEGEVFVQIEAQLTAERDELKAECERLRILVEEREDAMRNMEREMH